MLFDFFTPLEFRKQGYYSSFLKKIGNFLQKDNLVIFAAAKNAFSNKAISQTGFVQSIYEIVR